ncbi:MAG: hypothetical protein K2Y23_22910 [Cyanobacteria bacterium]|nr:hypothetical protein [Cyanobacteriota bacterium]
MAANSFALDILAAGSAATALTTATILCLGHERDSSMWAPLNAVSHIAFGDEAAAHAERSTKYTGTGTALNTAAMFSWAAMHAGVMKMLPRQDLPSAIGAGVAVSAAAYAIDYYVVPRRLTPGFEKRLSGRSLFWIYSALAAGLAAGWAANRSRDR